ncbi:MAG TPA: flavodoxin family protein [Rhizomicrobium sp.]|nr:flavodoxin family protein [Rhizomicrobium sp.]
MPHIRKGQAPDKLARDAFAERFRASFDDPMFDRERAVLERIEEIAWDAYCKSRKSPRTSKAGPGFADPDYALSDEWRAASEAIELAQLAQKGASQASRVLLVQAAARNEGTCPGEMAKSYRLCEAAAGIFKERRIEVDLLDLSHLSSVYGRKIHPCKSCVATAMPLCHWPCSCYPNHSLGQTGDWMAEIYARLARAHGLMIVTPVYWGQAPGGLKSMMDRLVCADGGNPDPSSTQGKDAAKAKALELDGWPYPKHLAGRVYGLVVHGDTADAGTLRASLAGWLEWSGFVPSGAQSQIDRYIGYFKPYATSHDSLDEDEAMFEETRNVARAVSNAVAALREGRLAMPDADLKAPRRK